MRANRRAAARVAIQQSIALFGNNIGNSTYHALQAKLEKRLSRGLTVTAAYTFSKLIDDASSVFSAAILSGPVANTGVADAYNRRLERDLSNGDIPQVFSAGWVYDLPHGWRVAGMVRGQSGDTIAISQAANPLAAFGFGIQRPNRVADRLSPRRRRSASATARVTRSADRDCKTPT